MFVASSPTINNPKFHINRSFNPWFVCCPASKLNSQGRNLTVEVVDYVNIPTQSYIEIGNEVMYVKSKTSPNKLSVRRAQNGTKASAATAGTPVDIINVEDDNLLTGGDDFGFSETVSYYE